MVILLIITKRDTVQHVGFKIKNPDHPEIDEIRKKIIKDAEEWKCIKWSREEGPLPIGPKSHRN